jgi:hypothetical protein
VSHYAECHYAECHYAQCHFAECHFAECQYAECRYAECPYAECRYVFSIMALSKLLKTATHGISNLTLRTTTSSIILSVIYP